MNLSKELQKTFAEEIEFALKGMRGTSSVSEKLYYYSGVYAAAQRIFNTEFDPEMVFIHNVLQNSHQLIHVRSAQLQQGVDPHLKLPETFFAKLEADLEKLALAIKKGGSVYPTLQDISNLAFITTGNGYHLYLKGLISV